VLVDRVGGTDFFLGHGSGRRNSAGMRGKLAEEFNDVARSALTLTQRVDGGNATANAELTTRFPNVARVGGQWRIRGRKFNRDIDFELRTIRPTEVLALHDPYDPTQFYGVRRPVESQ
jgi:hypothetical protein